MITSQRIADGVRLTLRDDFDIGAKAFSDEDLVDYINRALPFIVAMDGSASITTTAVSLVEGVHQSLPERGVKLIAVLTNNLDSYKARIDGRLFTGKSAPKVLPFTTMNAQNREWANSRQTDVVTVVMFNKDDPKAFMVYPPNTGDGSLVISYSYIPAEVTEINSTAISISERYFNAIIYHVMFSCLMRDSEDTANSQRAQNFYQMAVAEVNGLSASDATETVQETVKA